MSSRPFPHLTVGDLKEALEQYPDNARVFLTSSMVEGTSPDYMVVEWALDEMAYRLDNPRGF